MLACIVKGILKFDKHVIFLYDKIMKNFIEERIKFLNKRIFLNKGRYYSNLDNLPRKIFSNRTTWVGYKGRVIRLMVSGFVNDMVRIHLSSYYCEIFLQELYVRIPTSMGNFSTYVDPYIPTMEEIKCEIIKHIESLFLQTIDAYR